MKTTTPGGGAVIPSHIAVKRKATGLTEYYEVRQTPAGAMNIPISKEEYDAKTGGGTSTSVEVLGPAKRITEFAIKEAGAYVLSGDWYPTREEAEQAVQDLGAVAPMFQVVEVTYDDLEGHVPALLAQVQKNRMEEADAIAAEEAVGIEALRKEHHPDTPMDELSHDQKVALVALLYKEAKK